MSNITTWMRIDKNATKLEDVNVVKAIALKDVGSFIIDTSAMSNKDEEVLSEEGFVKIDTFTRDDGTGVTRKYAVYKRRILQ